MISRRISCTSVLLGFAAFAAAAAAAGDDAKPNHLITEKSPYLRQHAFNPVDWYPWGEEAFAKARAENKPIFLSIGYSTCHWCHEMERESFVDAEVARLLNDSFVSIKVDREERPDVDRVYLTFVQASTGNGGWPLSVWLTPELKPFFGGTYFPREDQNGRPGFKTLLARMATLWSGSRERVVEQSSRMLAALQTDTGTEAGGGALPIAALRQRTFEAASATFDAQNGGFGVAPKFPEPAMLEFLFDVHATTGDAAQRAVALHMAVETLRHIVAGGIHDQLGGGFHRYAVDPQWRVPHFEKMLYDQAQLANVCLTAWQLTHDELFRDAALDTLAYVQRRLSDPAGGFYSAEDADSAIVADPTVKREGAFYVWTVNEIAVVLGPQDAAQFSYAFGVEAGGNVDPSVTEGLAGQNILFQARSPEECAKQCGLTVDAAQSALAAAIARLREAREQRPRPLRDEKIITAWNGLMISAFARAAQITDDKRWSESAQRAATFVRANLVDPASGRLARSFCDGVRAGPGFAEDHAFMIQGLLDLYETTFDVRWLQWATELQQQQDTLFWDAAGGGYFSSAADDASVVLRLKEDTDGAEPSANSVAVRNLARLAELLHREEWREQAERVARAFAPQFERAPTAMPQMLAALGWLERPPQRILVHGEPTSPGTTQLVAEVWQRFLPRHVLLRIDDQSRVFFAAGDSLIAALPESTASTATAYVCENFACQQPTSDPAVLAAQLHAAGFVGN